MEAITEAGFKPGEDIYIASIPLPANFTMTVTMFMKARVSRGKSAGERHNSGKLGNGVSDCLDRRRDGRGDWNGWKILTDAVGKQMPAGRRRYICDQCRIFAEGSPEERANSILIKVNQIGTLTETLAAVEMAQRAGYTAVMSHRSGETGIRRSAISLLRPIAARSKPARLPVRTGSRSTIN